MKIRVGFGYDTHQFEAGRKLFLGGLEIDYPYGLKGHSDADVLLHAICDALLGAANLRDIGFHFSDQDPKFKNIDSKILLNETGKLLLENGWNIGNIDCTVVAEFPKINPHVEKMQEIISTLLDISQADISIKATTNEKMDAIGQGQGIKVYAVCLITKN